MICKKTIPSTQVAGLVPVVLMSLLVQCGNGHAADGGAAAQFTIEQPERPLADMLLSIAHDTGTSVLFDSSAVRSRVAHAVSGHLSAFEAITAALQGTGLVAAQMKDGAIVVSAPATRSVAPASSASASSPSAKASPTDLAPVAAIESKQDDTVTRVEVTGTRLKRISAEGPEPVNIYTAKDIEQSGQPNLGRFLAGLNEVSVSSGEGAFGATLGQATVQLRGLPVGSTLVLINGRRVQAMGSTADNYFNLNVIPTSAIERVEIVPVGSSAVYGGDALAGVVNVILKKSMEGISVTAGLGSGHGFDDGNFSMATGGHTDNGNYLVIGSYTHATPLGMAGRGFFQDADYRRFGGSDARATNCTPGTVSSVSGANLPGLDSSFAGIPKLPSGQTPQISDYAATAGAANLCNRFVDGKGYPLLYGDDALTLHATGEYKFLGSWFAFGELTLAKDRLEDRDLGLGLSSVTVPASNAYNPFGQDVKVTTVLGPENGLRGFGRQTTFVRALAGVRGTLTSDWDAEATVSTSRDNTTSQTIDTNVDTVARAAALASSSPALALNPFTTGRAASDDVLHGIWSDSDRRGRGRKEQVTALIRGNVLQLPAGPLEAVVGTELAHDRFDSVVTNQPEVHDGRRDSAVYGEVQAPLLSAGAPGKTWNLAALTMAARRDRYSDFGSSSTYQTGLELRPLRSLLLRASSATSFKPPTLLEMNLGEMVSDADDLVDPARGGEAVVNGTIVTKSNPALTPEHGRANSFGAVWEPEGSLGTRLAATHWQVHIAGLIVPLDPQVALDNEAQFPGFVTRGPAVDGQPGLVLSVLDSYANFGSVDAAGTDMEATYAWRSSFGRWIATVGATRTSEYRVVLAPGEASENRLGRRFADYWAPRWKSRASLSFDAGFWTLGLTGRYLGQYKDAGTSERRLGAYWMEDLAASLDLKKSFPNLAAAVKGASIALSIANLSDRQPQYVETLPYYDVTQADWRGRYVSTKVSVDW